MLTAQSATTTGILTLAATLSGVGITSIAALATAYLNRRWQQRDSAQSALRDQATRLHEERKEVYSQYVLNIALVYQHLKSFAESAQPSQSADVPRDVRDLQAQGEAIRAGYILVASNDAISAMEEYRREQVRLVRKAYGGGGFHSLTPQYDRLTAAMRADIRA